jgi:hypothetical protein
MSEKENNNGKEDEDKEMFVKLLKYSTPITVAMLLYVGLITLEGEFPIIVIIFVMVVLEIVMGVKAEELYEYMND